MDENFFKTNLTDKDGYSWTLTSRFGKMLQEVEEIFGSRDREWTVLGVEFSEDGPYIWYPAELYNKSIIIHLSHGIMNSIREACWELSHEVVHLLSPTGKASTNVLEEGLAVYYSKKYVMSNFDYDHPNSLPSYAKAYELVKPILDNNPGIIKRIREEEPIISKINKELLLKHIPELSEKIADLLASKFDRDAT